MSESGRQSQSHEFTDGRTAKFFVAGSRRPVAEFRPPIAWLFLAWRYSRLQKWYKIEHRFEDFTDDFAIWVIFYGPEGGEKNIR